MAKLQLHQHLENAWRFPSEFYFILCILRALRCPGTVGESRGEGKRDKRWGGKRKRGERERKRDTEEREKREEGERERKEDTGSFVWPK